jgi:hypothetical protein
MEKNSIVQRLPRLNGKATGCSIPFEKGFFLGKSYQNFLPGSSMESFASSRKNDSCRGQNKS